MSSPPTGTVTFLFTDIQGSTRLWQNHPHKMKAALARHDRLLRETIESNKGWVFKTIGDAFCAAFDTAMDGLKSAVAMQITLASEVWDLPEQILVRAALHTGEAEERDRDYYGPALNRVARLLGIGHGGQILLSLVATELVRDDLPEGVTLRELGAQRLKDLTRPEAVFQVLHSRLRSDFPRLNSLDAHPHNLPTQPTQLIGRESELAAVESLVRDAAARIVTLTGPGGMGKTRLALQAAADLIDEFPHGVYFVDLAPIGDHALVVPAIARALRLREAGGRAIHQTVTDHLREKSLLLVLDNFEQVMGAATHVTEILAECPGVRCLVTSRESLTVRGEKVFSVPPLGFPAVDRRVPIPARALTHYEAVRLFVERAVGVQQEFRVTNANAPAVAEICARLEGIPLAIELAAARVRLLSPEEILARLGNALAFLTSGARDLPDRQRTLRATIEWSNDLLDPSTRSLFRRLSVFVGGFTLEAAEAVSAATGTRGIDPLDGIESLANKSLLMREEREGRVTRLRMLEAIRSFGLERLEEGPDAGKTRRAHAEYFLTFSESAELQGRHQKAWLERIDADYENLRGAMEWFDAEGDRELLARVAVSLVPFWEIRCNLTDGETWLSKALSGARDMPKALIARLDEGGGILARQRGDYERSSRLIEESRTIFEQIGDANGLARAAANLGKTFYRMDALGKMRENNIDAMRMAQKIDDLPLAAVSGMGLGLVDWREGSIEHARERFEECRRIFREHGYRREEAQAINNLGAIQYQRRSYASAAEYFREAMTIQEEIGDLDDLRNVYNNLADVHCQIGDYARSGAYYEKLLDLATSHRDLRGASNAYSGLAEVHLVLGNAVEARRHARLALDAALQAGPGVELGVAYRVLGDIALSFGEIQEAERNYRLGIPLLENASELSEKDKACCGYEYALEILRGTSFQSHV